MVSQTKINFQPIHANEDFKVFRKNARGIYCDRLLAGAVYNMHQFGSATEASPNKAQNVN